MYGEVLEDRIKNKKWEECKEEGEIWKNEGLGIIKKGKRFIIGIIRYFNEIKEGKKKKKMMRDEMKNEKLWKI